MPVDSAPSSAEPPEEDSCRPTGSAARRHGQTGAPRRSRRRLADRRPALRPARRSRPALFGMTRPRWRKNRCRPPPPVRTVSVTGSAHAALLQVGQAAFASVPGVDVDDHEAGAGARGDGDAGPRPPLPPSVDQLRVDGGAVQPVAEQRVLAGVGARRCGAGSRMPRPRSRRRGRRASRRWRRRGRRYGSRRG